MDDLPIIIKDTREKTGYSFRKSETCGGMEVTKLDTGDYSVKGLEHIVSIERKSISDLYGSLGKKENKERFFKEMERMKEIPYRYLAIDGTLSDVMAGYKYSKMNPKYVRKMLFEIEILYGVHILFLGKGERGRDYVRYLLIKIHSLYGQGLLNG